MIHSVSFSIVLFPLCSIECYCHLLLLFWYGIRYSILVIDIVMCERIVVTLYLIIIYCCTFVLSAIVLFYSIEIVVTFVAVVIRYYCSFDIVILLFDNCCYSVWWFCWCDCCYLVDTIHCCVLMIGDDDDYTVGDRWYIYGDVDLHCLIWRYLRCDHCCCLYGKCVY